MILVDSSAWVEFLRDTGSPVRGRVDELLAEEFGPCHPIRIEVLAGARDERHLRDLLSLLARTTILQTLPTDHQDAAGLDRTCRRRGETVRKLIDCLIAAHAIRADVALLHADPAFDILARHTELTIDGA